MRALKEGGIFLTSTNNSQVYLTMNASFTGQLVASLKTDLTVCWGLGEINDLKKKKLAQKDMVALVVWEKGI